MISLAVLTLIGAVLSVTIGSVYIPIADIAGVLSQHPADDTYAYIIMDIRLPRMIIALVLGGALSVSGFLLQTYFENPIAGPFVLGISSGAKMMVSLVMIFFLYRFKNVSSFVLIFAAFIGSLMVTGIILIFANRLRSMASLLVAGIMIGYICGAVSEFVITFADDSDIVNLHGWTQGSFAGANWGQVMVSLVVVIPVTLITFFMSKQIGAFLIGERYAASMGVSVKRFRLTIIVLSSILSATVTAFAGPISFVGIAVPILMRRILKSSKPLYVIPATFLGGACFCMFCDLIARQILAPTELMISNVTAVFGAPIVIISMLKRRRGGYE